MVVDGFVVIILAPIRLRIALQGGPMPPCHRRAACLIAIGAAVLSAISAPSPALSQQQPIDTTNWAIPYKHAALTVEGGGTLGAYEGGLTWALVEIFRQRRVMGLADSVQALAAKPVRPFRTNKVALATVPRFEFHASAGASAGSINAFIAANRWCGIDAPEREDESSFWKVWVQTGLAEVLPRRRDADWHSEKAVFTRSRFTPIFAALDEAWKRSHYDATCKVLFGAAITRLADDSVVINDRIHPRNQRYAAAFEVKAPESGLGGSLYRARLSAADDRLQLGALAQLPTSKQAGTIQRAYVYALLNASSGYPLAFQPQLVHYCSDIARAGPMRPRGVCVEGAADSAYFVDGGVFDNGPLTLGYGMALAVDRTANLGNLAMLFISPGQRRFTDRRHDIFSPASSPDATATTARPDTLRALAEKPSEGVDALARLLSAFVPSARQYEMQITGRLLPAVQKADSQLSNAQSDLDRAKAIAEAQKRRADFEHDGRLSDLQNAAEVLESTRFLRDSLRFELASCRLTTVACPSPSLGEDALVKPAQHRDVPAATLPDLPPFLSPADTAQDGIPFQKHLYTSTRFHPLAGDWLFGFGGFIGQSLREYDFYVGIYDGLALIARQVICADREKDPDCFARELYSLITNPVVPVSGKGTAALRALYDEEFPPRQGRSRLLTPEDSTAYPAVINIVKAMGSRMRTGVLPEHACSSGGVIERLSCSDGMENVFAALRNTQDFAEHGMLETCAPGSPEGASCADSRFNDFVKDPNIALNKLTGEVLERLLGATPHNSSLRIPLTVATATFFATNERTRTGVDAGSVSLPSLPFKKLFLFLAIPSSVGGFGGIPGLYAEWAARSHRSTNATLGVSARTVWRSGFKDSTTNHRGRLFIPSVRAEVKPWGVLSPWVSTAGIDVSYWSDEAPYSFWRNWDNRALTAGATAALLAQRVRLSIYVRPRRYWVKRANRPPLAVSIGAGDVSGFIYWLIRAKH